MDWNELGSIGELVSALAVIVSVVYVAIQLKANTRTNRAKAAQEAEELFIELNVTAATNPEISNLTVRIYQAKSLDDFDETENMQIRLLVIAWTQAVQAQYFMWREGTLLDEVWEYRLNWFRNWILVPVMGEIWEESKPENLFSEKFINEVESERGLVEFRLGVTRKKYEQDLEG